MLIRPLTTQDAPAFAQAFRDDPGLGAALGVDEDPTEETVGQQIAQLPDRAAAGRRLELALCWVGTGEFAGSLVVLWCAPGCVESGCWTSGHDGRAGSRVAGLAMTFKLIQAA